MTMRSALSRRSTMNNTDPVSHYEAPRRKYALYILGAGFSQAAGLPLADDLWKEVLRRALPMQGRASKFRNDLDDYIEFRARCDGVTVSYEDVNFEEFLGFLDIEHYLGLRGSETWSEAGNEGQVVVKTLVGQILTELTPSAINIPKLYIDFAKLLKPGDCVLSFNYDVLLERALEAAKVAYRLFPHRYTSVSKWSASTSMDTSASDAKEVKMHGSVDWFDRQPFLDRQQDARERGFHSFIPGDPVFHSERGIRTVPVVDGPRFPNDPLGEMHRVVNAEILYSHPPWFLSVPSLVAPSVAKVIYSRQYADFWHGLRYGGAGNMKMVIIGYSLPRQDDYARQVIYRFVDNYQSIPAEEVSGYGRQRDPIIIVDLHRNQKQLNEFKRRYSFVDWSKAILYSDGFNESVFERLAT